MMRSTVVEDYLKSVKRELVGVESPSIIEEISDHINEKANDIARENGLKSPDDGVFKRVISDLGAPDDVVKPYLKEMPLTLPTSVKVFLILQILTGIAAFLIFVEGMDTLMWAFDQTPDDTGFILTQIVSNLFFFLIFVVMSVLTFLQWKKPFKIVYLGSISMVFSISVIVAIIFVMFRVITWNVWGVEYGENSYYPIAGMVMVGFIVLYMLGFQQLERFQRRIHLSEEGITKLKKDRKQTRVFVISTSSVFMVLLILVAIGQSMYSEEYYDRHELLRTQEIGGTYDAKLELWEHREGDSWWEERKIVYNVDGEEIHGAFLPEMQRSLDWIINSTSTDAVIMSWWDYGHSIKGYTGREVVLDDPTRDMRFSVADPSSIHEWETDEEKLTNVAKAFVTTDLNFTAEIMEMYDADYIITNYRDASSIDYALLHAAFEPDPLSSYMPTLDEDSFLYKVWNGEDVNGFEIVYSDLEVKILRRSLS